MSKHTPIPWSIVRDKIAGNERGSYYTVAVVQKPVSVGDGATAEGNADFIVEACNNYEKVKAQRGALADALDNISSCCPSDLSEVDNDDLIKIILTRKNVYDIRAALKLAGR